MCGTAGLFVGCPVAATCPRHLFATRVAGDVEYRSPFAGWDDRTSVRRRPRRAIAPADAGLRLFPRDLVPLLRHPLICERGPAVEHAVTSQHLQRYLAFTAYLEHFVVNRTALAIAHGFTGLGLPDEMRLDAFRIYCDEAYHALFCADLARQAIDHSGVAFVSDAEPFFVERLRRIQAGVDRRLAELVELLFVICSETLITATLLQVGPEADVVPAVHETIRDHAADEGRHHEYFARFLKILWAQLGDSVRQTAALTVPRLIEAFLEPDLPSTRLELRGYGFDGSQIEEVLAGVYPNDVVRSTMRATASRTVRHFQDVGALRDPEVEAAFAAVGLLDNDDVRPGPDS